ncbi:hypothetical protein D3C71_1731330 [compost metagenome]
MHSIRIQNYLTVTGTSIEQTEGRMITVSGEYNFSNIHKQDKLIWYIKESGEHYEGTVIRVDSVSPKSKLEMEVTPRNWTTAEQENGMQFSDSPVFIDLPLGKVTIWNKIFHRGAAE